MPGMHAQIYAQRSFNKTCPEAYSYFTKIAPLVASRDGAIGRIRKKMQRAGRGQPASAETKGLGLM